MIKNYLLVFLFILSIGGFFDVVNATHPIFVGDCPGGLQRYSFDSRPHYDSSTWLNGMARCAVLLKSNNKPVLFIASNQMTLDDCEKLCDYPNSCRNGGGRSAKGSVFDGGLFAPVRYTRPMFESNSSPIPVQFQFNPSSILNENLRQNESSINGKWCRKPCQSDSDCKSVNLSCNMVCAHYCSKRGGNENWRCGTLKDQRDAELQLC